MILLLIVALGISLALLVQQSMNMAMLSQPTAMQTTGGSAGDQTMPSQNTTDEKRTDPQQSEHSDATANPESDTTQSPHMQTDGSDAGASTHGLINLLSLKLLRFVPCQTAFRHRVKHRVVVT